MDLTWDPSRRVRPHLIRSAAGGTVDWFKRIPIAALAIVVGAISAIAWITVGGTVAIVISILAGASIALRATLGDE